MNKEVRIWLEKHKDKFIKPVLEVGSYNENGSVQDVAEVDVGVDIRRGPGVDVVGFAEDLPDRFGHGTFNTVVSCEMLEHALDWRGAIRGMWDVLAKDGLLIFTMAAIGKRYHGYPADYWRMTEAHFNRIFPGTEMDYIGLISIGGVIKKAHPLPSLERIQLLRIHPDSHLE